MFLHVSVILFPGGISVSVLMGEVSVPGGSPSQGHLRPSGLCPGGSLSRGVFVMETPHMVTSGRYTSNWNAFLFICLSCVNFSVYLNRQSNTR